MTPSARSSFPIDGVANRRGHLAERAARLAATWTLGRLERRQRDRCSARKCSAPRRRSRSPAISTATACTDIGVFIDGQWFLDLNGNGQWDEGDLWAKLGTRTICPSPAIGTATARPTSASSARRGPRDPWAIAHEPGLPDADNYPDAMPRGKTKNMPPTSRGRDRAAAACCSAPRAASRGPT